MTTLLRSLVGVIGLLLLCLAVVALLALWQFWGVFGLQDIALTAGHIVLGTVVGVMLLNRFRRLDD